MYETIYIHGHILQAIKKTRDFSLTIKFYVLKIVYEVQFTISELKFCKLFLGAVIEAN